jgi:hypothetical protein
MPNMEPLGPVTRIHIVTPDGSKEYWADSWQISRQDGGRTLKIFATGDGSQARADRNAALAQFIADNPVGIPDGVPPATPDEARWQPPETALYSATMDVEFRSWKLRQIDRVVHKLEPIEAIAAIKGILKLNDEEVADHMAAGLGYQPPGPGPGERLPREGLELH